jgi:hypothetical protein
LEVPTSAHQDTQVDGLMLMNNENAGVEYQWKRVRNPSEKMFRTSNPSIQKLVVLIPVRYRHEEDSKDSCMIMIRRRRSL